MKRHYLKDIALTVVYVLYVVLDLFSSPSAPSPLPDSRIRQRIADLASDDFAAREAASKALVEAGDAAVPALEAAAKDPSPEVQARARAALKAIEGRKVQPGKVLETLYGSAAFVEGGTLTLRDALRPVEKLGLRVDYDTGVDPAQPCSLTKHGQTALELVDQLAETCRLGSRIVPGGVRIVPKERLDALHTDLRQRLSMPMAVEWADLAFEEVVKEVSEKLEVPIVLSPGVKEDGKTDRKISLKVQQLPATSLLRLAASARGLGNVEPEARYGIIVLIPKSR